MANRFLKELKLSAERDISMTKYDAIKIWIRFFIVGVIFIAALY